MMEQSDLRIFTGNANPALARAICRELEIPLGKMQLTTFADGEVRVTIEESARGMDVFLIQPTCIPVNDNIMQLLLMVDAFRRASARRITVVVPYYGYCRQDKKIKPREPVSARLVADLITAAGANRVLSIDLHAGQIQGFFQMPLDHLFAGPLLAIYFREKGFYESDTVVVSPDVGGVARARAMAEMLGASLAIIAKRRPEPNKVEIMEIIGHVDGKTCVMIDDMIDTGGSIVHGAMALKERGARRIYACCSHGLFSRDALEKIHNSPIEEVVTTDTVPVTDEQRAKTDKLRIISVAPLLADAIQRINLSESVSELFESYW